MWPQTQSLNFFVIPACPESFLECGKTYSVHCPHCKAMVTRRQIVLSDFLIGAHALEQADCLLSRDLGIYKSNFSDLKVISRI